MINKAPDFRVRNISISIIIPIRGRGFINPAFGLGFLIRPFEPHRVGLCHKPFLAVSLARQVPKGGHLNVVGDVTWPWWN